VHRLGQSRRVQIVTMVAAGAYEEQVLGLVNTKQDLFDNVVGEDATEDVVGVSKKVLDALIEDLTGEQPAAKTREEAAVEADETREERPADGKMAPGTFGDPALDAAIARCIEALQQAFGSRIDRIFASEGGLFVVLDQVDAAADAVAEGLSAEIPVALIDPFSLKGLQRLGAASPLAGARPWYDAAEERTQNGMSRMRRLAVEKLKAAKVLLDREMAGSALDLTVAALLATASDLAGKDTPVPTQDVGVWIFSEALPAGVLDPQDASLIMKGVSLAQGRTVPESLVAELLDDADRFVSH
jgi:hypothetical protein